ncbi:sialate O-acetylesterase [uncultured Mucilaginibacter sp.]|uniref:sialate O-acetylesterase n=1 Tax=uncultured Mucilaginibacter sp. TaxID=797541 RepID=UPI0025DE5911|nr:sialate O-acetylesterase [uncultured Mucilaginibacter sp.]
MKPHIKFYVALLIFFCAANNTVCVAQNVFNIKSYGAVESEFIDNAKAIQKAIDVCASKGGGDVLIPDGKFLSGTIFLKSNVTLFLSPLAVLKGSAKMVDYDASNALGRRGFICAFNQQNIGIAGTGSINGQGEADTFYSADMKNGLPGRPNCIVFNNCTNVVLKDFTLRNSAHWSIDIKNCDSIKAESIKVFSNVVANNDGIDLTDCHTATILNCEFICGDDAICLKSDSKRGVNDVIIKNCRVSSQSNAIKFGTKSVGGFANVNISDCKLYDTRLSGLALEVVDGGTLNNIRISNITMNKVNGAIFMKLGKRSGNKSGSLYNVELSNITADSIGYWKPDRRARYFKDAADERIGVVLSGMPMNPITGISLNNIKLRFAGGGLPVDAAVVMPEVPAVYPEYSNWGVTSAYGINLRHAKNVNIKGLVLSSINTDARPAILTEDVDGIRIQKLDAKVTDAKSVIKMSDTKNVFISQSVVQPSVAAYLSLSGNIKQVNLYGNDFKGLGKVYTLSNSVSENEITGLKSKPTLPIRQSKPLEIYLLMGQSNMAGRGVVNGTLAQEHNDSVLVLNKDGDWVVAHHPLHYDKPSMAGAGPGLMFGIEMKKAYPGVTIGLVPCAVGGTSIEKWMPGAYDEVTKTHPYDDAVARIEAAMKQGTIKGVIWHQGEANSSPQSVGTYLAQLSELIGRIRKLVKNPELPFVAGKLGLFNNKFYDFNMEIVKLPQVVSNTAVVLSDGLDHKGDGLHFSGPSADELGRRYAEKMLELEGKDR